MHMQCTDRSDGRDGKKDAQLTIRLPKKLLEAAHEKAERSDIPISQVVRLWLRRWVAEDPPKKDD